MNLQELFPGVEIWDIDRLISDLNTARNQLGEKEMTKLHEYYLCGTLVGYSPSRIARELISKGIITRKPEQELPDGKAIRTALSEKIKDCVLYILKDADDLTKKMEWSRACFLLEKAGYKKVSRLIITLDCINTNQLSLDNAIDKIGEIVQDKSIKIQDIRRGSIELVLSGSPEGLKRLASLIESGELTEINGVRIISVESVVEPSKVVRLSNWWDNLVESGWSALEQVLSPQQLELATVRSGNVSNVSKGKLIDRTMLDGGFTVVLALKPEKLADGSCEIVLRLYPTGELKYLPPGIELRMFYKDDDGNQESTNTRAGSSDEWIELKFPGESGEEFGVEVVKEDISVIENFVI